MAKATQWGDQPDRTPVLLGSGQRPWRCCQGGFWCWGWGALLEGRTLLLVDSRSDGDGQVIPRTSG